MLIEFVRSFWQICLFKKEPHEIPYSVTLLVTVTLINVVLGEIAIAFLVSLHAALWQGLVLLALHYSFIWLLLLARQKRERFVQTATAVFGVGIIMSLFVWLLLGLQVLIPANMHVLLLILLIGLTVWAVSVTGFIFAKALDMHLMIGVFFSILMAFMSNAVVQWLVQHTRLK